MSINPPKPMTYGELYDANKEAWTRLGMRGTECDLLYQRQARLEDWVRAQVEGAMEAMHGKCLLGECQPQWEPKSARYVHTPPCRLAAAEQLLREHLDPYDAPVYRHVLDQAK